MKLIFDNTQNIKPLQRELRKNVYNGISYQIQSLDRSVVNRLLYLLMIDCGAAVSYVLDITHAEDEK